MTLPEQGKDTNQASEELDEICMCCEEIKCDYSTIGCPWYVNADYLEHLLERVKPSQHAKSLRKEPNRED